ncbi:MAG: methylmalonyl-CoA mutase family protein [bacterium]|nr:methylmalonyl-CoA mutase family protein [bacterium]
MTSEGVASMLRFDAPPRRDWEDLVRRSLRGDPPDALVGRTADGLDIQPLYTAAAVPAGDAAGLPGLAPFTRGAGASPGRWELRQRHDLADPAETSAAIRSDIAGGVSGVWLRLRRSPAPGELLAALSGVNPAETSVLVDGGPWFAAAAEAAAALAAAAPPGWLIAGADPLGALARHGFLLQDLDETLAGLAPLVGTILQREERDGAPARPGGGRCVTVDAAVYCDAGAPPALELACMLATGVAYLRALETGGLTPSQSAPHLEARLATTADQFATICKFRAARALWDRLLGACGVPDPERRALRCWAVTSEAMFVAQDPFVNLVRATAAAFAAAAGGAECITVLPHDVALGAPGERGRRLARNVSHLLAEETHLGAVIDPGGGSWYVEDRTARLAEVAWERFREIEASGGMASALLDGLLAARIAQAAERRSERLAGGDENVVGVTCHSPPAGEADPGSAGSPSSAGATPAPSAASVRIPPLPLRRPGSEQS